MKTLRLLSLILMLSAVSFATAVRGTLVNGSGTPMPGGTLVFTLSSVNGTGATVAGCGDGTPPNVRNSGTITNMITPIVSGAGGSLFGTVVGNDQINCGAGFGNGTFYVVVAKDQTGAVAWTRDYNITGASWTPAATPLNVVPPSILAVSIISSPSASQTITQPGGTSLTINGTFIASLTGNASTASSLAANGSNCSAGSYAAGVDTGGNAEGCTPLPLSISGTLNQVVASASTGNITLSLPQSIATTSTPTFASQTLTNFLAIGAIPAGAGGIRLSNALCASGRNSGNTADLQAYCITAANTVTFGPNAEITANGGLTFTMGAAARWIFASANGNLSGRSDGVMGFSATTTPGTNDTGISRGASAGATVFGNGTAGDFSGTIKTTVVNAVTGFQVNGSALAFTNIAGTAIATQGGTGQSTYAVGDILVGAASNTLAKVTVGSSGQCLVVVGATWAPGPCSSGSLTTVQNAGTPVTSRPTINLFNGLQAADNAGSSRTDISPVYGSAANTVAQGNDSRIVNAAQVGSANTFTALNTFSVGAATSAAIIMSGGGAGLAYIDGSSGTGGQGGVLQFTNDASSTTGYSGYIVQNAFYNGTSWIQMRGVGTSSHALAVSHHKDFSFNFAAAGGTNNTAITWTEWANLNATGFNLKVGTYQINGTQISATNLSNGTSGSGAVVLVTSASLVTPTIGVATATSINKVAITAPATSATLTIINGKTLTANNTLTFAGTDATTITFQGTDTYVGRGTTDTLIGKSIDAEASGNNITQPVKLWYPSAGCNNASPTPFWDTSTATVPSAVCVTGTNVVKGLLRYAVNTQQFAEFHYKLPADLTTSTNWDVNLYWTTATASGTATFTIDYACTSTAATDDPTFTAWQTFSATAGAANVINIQSSTAQTTTCTAGQLIHLRVKRTDTAGTATNADIYGVELTYRRTM